LRLAVLADAHANLPALNAVLDEVGKEGCDEIIHLGDAIGIGPYPAECLDRLLKTPRVSMIMGNHEAHLAFGLPKSSESWDRRELDHYRWVRRQIRPSLRKAATKLPYQLTREAGGMKILFLHYPLDESGGFARIPSRDQTPADLDRLFAPSKEGLVFYGHTHRQSDVMGRARYVNPGCLGVGREPVAPFAFLVLGGGPSYTIERRAVTYDDHELLEEFKRRKVPDRDRIIHTFFGR